MEYRNISEENDHDLVLRVQNGDNDAYDQLMLRYQDVIAQQMRRFSRDPNEIDELTQTVFVRAFFSLETYRPHSPFSHWLRTIASRAGYDFWRGEKKRAKHVPLTGLEETTAAKESGDDGEGKDIQQVLDVMEELSPDERQLLYLVYLDGLSVREVAETMGWGVAMTKMRSFRARRKLRAILQKKGDGK